MTRTYSRRRFLWISAATAGIGLAARGACASERLHQWRGVALGADASLILHHDDRLAATSIISEALSEVGRLERIFSLYHADSALVRLNRAGRLTAPPPELLEVLAQARDVSEASDGAFDVSVQSLWKLYYDHFSKPGTDLAGPAPGDVRQARTLTDYRNIRLAPEEITFARPGMAVTLNGIAQGYITDRVTSLLRKRGMVDVLVNMGEIRALGGHPGGRPWRIGLDGNRDTPAIDLRDAAVATSATNGFVFGGGLHHILDPRADGGPAPERTVSVVARSATIADALSTAALLLDGARARDLCREFDANLIA